MCRGKDELQYKERARIGHNLNINMCEAGRESMCCMHARALAQPRAYTDGSVADTD